MLTIPVSFAIGDVDTTIDIEGIKQIEGALKTLPDEARGEIRVYKNGVHGFCVRADHSTLDLSRQAREAEDQCLDWFRLHFQKYQSAEATRSGSL